MRGCGDGGVPPLGAGLPIFLVHGEVNRSLKTSLNSRGPLLGGSSSYIFPKIVSLSCDKETGGEFPATYRDILIFSGSYAHLTFL